MKPTGRRLGLRAQESGHRGPGRHELVGPGPDNIYKYRGATIELNSSGTRWWHSTVRFRSQEIDFEGRSSEEALEKAKEWIDAAPELREAARYPTPTPPPRQFVAPRVADFNTLDDLISHAKRELGATHVSYPEPGTMQGISIYFPRKDGQYERANTWEKAGYWHAQGPGNREIIRHLPHNAQCVVPREALVGRSKRTAETTHAGRRAAEPHRERSLDRLYGHTRGRDPYPFPSDRDRGISRLTGPKSGGAGAPTLMRPPETRSRSAHHKLPKSRK